MTKEGLAHEVKKDHEGPKAQKKEKERKKKYKKKRTQTWATSGIPILQEANPLRESLRDPEKDVDGLEYPKKDVGDLEDRTNRL